MCIKSFITILYLQNCFFFITDRRRSEEKDQLHVK